VIGVQAPLGEQLLHVTVGKREAQVPADRKQDHLRFKLAPLEQSGNRRGQEEHPASLHGVPAKLHVNVANPEKLNRENFKA